MHTIVVGRADGFVRAGADVPIRYSRGKYRADAVRQTNAVVEFAACCTARVSARGAIDVLRHLPDLPDDDEWIEVRFDPQDVVFASDDVVSVRAVTFINAPPPAALAALTHRFQLAAKEVLVSGRAMLLGQKAFIAQGGQLLTGCLARRLERVRVTETGVEVHPRVVWQKVVIYVFGDDGFITKVLGVRTGAHITPALAPLSPEAVQQGVLPVLFEPEDVTFADQSDVSVRRYTIPDPELVTELGLVESDFGALASYKQWYDLARSA